MGLKTPRLSALQGEKKTETHIPVMFVPFLSRLGWGWQVQRDKTVVWTMLQHSLIWVIGLQFEIVG